MICKHVCWHKRCLSLVACDELCDVCLLQLPIDYDRLIRTGWTSESDGPLEYPYMGICGLCYSEGKMHIVSSRLEVHSCTLVTHTSLVLSVYHVDVDSGKMTRWLGSIELPECHYLKPALERHSQIVLASYETGVRISRMEGNRLVGETTLTCVKNACHVAAMSPDSIYICDSSRVHLVDLIHNTITATLEIPSEYGIQDTYPCGVAVLGDTVMVGYRHALAIYSHGSTNHMNVVPSPAAVTSISTDRHHYFLIAHDDTKFVSVVDVKGNICHTVHIDTDREIVDCTVVNRQLWVGCRDGIVIMSS